MDKFIKLLLEKESTVILPNFGAIVIENESTGKLMFNEYLKYNDGKLDSIVVENSNMEIQEAQNAIAKYVREIQQDLDKGNEYSIYGLGSLKKDSDGDIIFVNDNKKTKDKEESKSEDVQGPSPTPTKQETKTEKPKKEEEKEEKNKEQENKGQKKEDKKEAIKKPVQKEKPSSKEKIMKDVNEKSDAKPSKKEEKKEAPNKNKEETKSKKSDTPSQGTPKKKKKSSKLILFVIILILASFGTGGILIATNYDQFKVFMGWDKFEEVKSPDDILAAEESDEDDDSYEGEDGEGSSEEIAQQNDEVELSQNDQNGDENDDSSETEQETEIEVEEPEVTEEPEIVKEPEPRTVEASGTSGNFYLIAGTFSEKSNAENLVGELKAKGHSAEIVGFLNNMHYVSVASFSTRKEAQQAVSGVQNDAPGAWVYKKP